MHDTPTFSVWTATKSHRMSFRIFSKPLRNRSRSRLPPLSSIFLRSFSHTFSQFTRFLLHLFLCEFNLSVIACLREKACDSVVIDVVILQTYVWHCVRHWWRASPRRCSDWRLSTSSEKVIWRFRYGFFVFGAQPRWNCFIVLIFFSLFKYLRNFLGLNLLVNILSLAGVLRIPYIFLTNGNSLIILYFSILRAGIN